MSSQITARLFFVLVALGVSGLSSAHAQTPETCAEVRVDGALGAIPLWNQEDSFLCYAFSASVLIDAYRLRQGPVSAFTAPLGLAADTVAYARSTNRRSSFWAGFMDQSFEAVRFGGACPAGWINDHLGSASLAELIPALRGFHRAAQAEEPMLVARRVISYLREKGGESGMGEGQIALELKKSQDEFLSALLGSTCGSRLPLVLPPLVSAPRPDWAKSVESVLSAGAPLAVEFCSEVVTDPKFSPGYGGQCGRHYVVVVGQRMAASECELLVRDSQCAQYKFRPGQAGCENSHYWVNRRHLLSNAFGVFFLAPL